MIPSKTRPTSQEILKQCLPLSFPPVGCSSISVHFPPSGPPVPVCSHSGCSRICYPVSQVIKVFLPNKLYPSRSRRSSCARQNRFCLALFFSFSFSFVSDYAISIFRFKVKWSATLGRTIFYAVYYFSEGRISLPTNS